MKKLIFIAVLFCSCQGTLRDNEHLIVDSQESYDNNMCLYHICINTMPYTIKFYIVDTCGKYQVNDTLKLNP